MRSLTYLQKAMDGKFKYKKGPKVRRTSSLDILENDV